MTDRNFRFTRKSQAARQEAELLNFGIDESDVSIIHNIEPYKLGNQNNLVNQIFDQSRTEDYFQSNVDISQNLTAKEKTSKGNRSKNNKKALSIHRNFDEDKKSTKSSERSRKYSSKLVDTRPTQKPNPELFNNLRRYSDESDGSFKDDSLMRFEHLSNAFDDSFQFANQLSAAKTTYLNIMMIGASHLGKFNFIEFFFEKCFNKKIRVDSEIKKVREFVHEINSRSLRRIVTVIHTQGYSEKYPMREWYKNLKHYITDKMETFDELRKLWHKDKKLQRQAVMDCRVHLCLYFVESPTISLDEIAYIRKLSKYVNIMPILVETRIGRFIDYDDIKHRVKRDLELNEVNWFDLHEHDLTFKSFRESLIAGTTPFLVAAPKGKLCTTTNSCDLNILAKMLITPYINTFYYKTEILWNINIEKIRENKVLSERKQIEEKKDGGGGISFGIALGIGFLGAIVAMKNKIL